MASSVYPLPLEDRESAQIGRRRTAAGYNPSQATMPVTEGSGRLPADTVGVALSGGGIRSATFCLGVFRALARNHLVRRIDVLSTVSGGGYFGVFLGGLFMRPSPRRSTPDDVEGTLLNLRSGPVDWLRENGRYMSPNGAGDTLLMGAILLRNWIAVMAVVTSVVLTLFAGTTWLGPMIPGWWQHLCRDYVWVAGVDRCVPWVWLPQAAVGFTISPYLALPLALVLLAVIPLIWAFWLTPSRPASFRPLSVPPAVFVVLILLVLPQTPVRDTVGGRFLLLETVATLVWWLVGLALFPSYSLESWRFRRNRHSRWLSATLWTAVALLLFGLIDGLGDTLAKPDGAVAVWNTLASAGASLFAVFAFAQKFLPGKVGEATLSLKPQVLAAVCAPMVAFILLVGLATLAHVIPPDSLGMVVLCGVVVAVVVGWTIPFLNLSSHSSLYGARLTRAYLGASNPDRHTGRRAITELIPGDQINLPDYDPPGSGGPLHLINVTVNQTMSAKSQLEQRDRKGMVMAIGPCGASVGRVDHALWAEGKRGQHLVPIALPGSSRTAGGDLPIFPGEMADIGVDDLDVGTWAGVSGAAFTTGLGARTSFAFSLLMGLANIRLGYWWNSGVKPHVRNKYYPGHRGTAAGWCGSWAARLLPVHAYLLDELLGRFHGPARHRWYLSDGGHVENTGAYELIRRRLPFIVLCDAGRDSSYQFDDFANLVRHVRTDFNAEIAVFNHEQLAMVLPEKLQPYFGTIEDFRLERRTRRPHALLAGVFYDDDLRENPPGSVMLILKPSLAGDEPADVVQYQREHNAFPQEPTSDQYFDEAQWESYRRLGEHIASRVFADISGVGSAWRPRSFCRPPVERLQWKGASSALNG
jgi:hypothetical protein